MKDFWVSYNSARPEHHSRAVLFSRSSAYTDVYSRHMQDDLTRRRVPACSKVLGRCFEESRFDLKEGVIFQDTVCLG